MRPRTSLNGSDKLRGIVVVGLMLLLWFALGQETDGQPLASTVVTNTVGFWSIPTSESTLPHRMKAEFLIYYFDPAWRVTFGEFSGVPTFLPISDAPKALKAGQKVEVDGVFIPAEQRILWDQTKLNMLANSTEFKPIATKGDLTNYARFTGQYVGVEGLVGSVSKADPAHVNLHLQADGMQMIAIVQLRQTNMTLPDWEGASVRFKGVYVEEKDINKVLTGLTVWVDDPSHVEITGRLSTDPRFKIQATPTEQISKSKPDQLLKVEGQVRNQEPGKTITIWDDTGQVQIETGQAMPLQIGERLEAIGYPFMQGMEARLRAGIYRRIAGNEAVRVTDTRPKVLRLAEQVRELGREEAGRGVPVSLEGVITWANPKTGFMFIMDGSAGIRVVNAHMEGSRAPLPRMMVSVKGRTGNGDFVPVITNAVVRQIGLIEFPEARRVSLEQALTGVEDGRWVELQGYVREVAEEGGLTRLDLTTWGGEFTAWMPAGFAPGDIKGSIIRIKGVCSVIPNAHRQLTGIELWTPMQQMIQVEQAAPGVRFALPYRSIGSLRQFNAFNALNQRVRTTGTVVLHELGRHLYVQDHGVSVFVLSRQADHLSIGDLVEVAGFPGNDGRKFLLREANYRRLSSGREPEPLKIQASNSPAEDRAGLLVEAEGNMLNVINRADGARLFVAASNAVFEVKLDGPVKTEQLDSLQKGSRLRLKGVYELQMDEYGKPRSFVIRLRSWQDIAVVQKAPWWTPARLWWVVAGVALVFLLALLYAVLVSGKNRQLHEAQIKLRRVNDELEDRVTGRTRELREEVKAKERAYSELRKAQHHMIDVSRQAGMAEVATGILHNVGNVLNSVNISCEMSIGCLKKSKLSNLVKVADLLKPHIGNFDAFLTQDAKGRQIPGYVLALTPVLVEEQVVMLKELQALREKIDHIKEIVAMQQSFAMVSGVTETILVSQLVEDALKLSQSTLERHKILVQRQFEDLPPANLEKHKILQILLNLIQNAKHAMQDGDHPIKEMTLRVFSLKPERVIIQVIDNGVGIAPENLTRIFAHGFTTRKGGHGFGLHSGALAAKELGGSLMANSAGAGQGATFSLELPVNSQKPL